MRAWVYEHVRVFFCAPVAYIIPTCACKLAGKEEGLRKKNKC